MTPLARHSIDEARAAYEDGRRLAGGIAGPSFGLGHLAAASGDEAGVDEAFRWLEVWWNGWD